MGSPVTLTEQDRITYLANVVFLALADAPLSPRETAALEEVRTNLGAKKSALSAALKAARSGQYVPVKVGPFPVQISNVADMLYLSLVDGDLVVTEKTIVAVFCRKIGLTQDQLNVMVREAIARADQTRLSITCPSCRTEISGDSKFCPQCGEPIGTSGPEPTAASFQIPDAGYAIEFCESTAASFPTALEYARSAPSFASTVRGKRNWYFASWPEQEFEKAAKLAELLGGMRIRKAYHQGKEIGWDELFGFAPCAGERSEAYKPVEYCFGKNENRVNPWGCKQARMDWTEWSRWFSYGEFRSVGTSKDSYVWVFDKERIRHELTTNLHRFRYCPHLRRNLLGAVLRALPAQVEVTADSPWKHDHVFEEVPGSLKIVEVKHSGNFEYTTEYYADGVRPKGLGILEEVLRKAFAEAGVTDITARELVS